MRRTTICPIPIALVLGVLLVSAAQGADPTWEYIYEADILPDDTSLGDNAWQLVGDSKFAEITDQGELHIDDVGENHCFFLYNVADAALMQQATIEARVKVLSQSGSADFEVLVGIQDGSNSKWLDLFPDHILLNNTSSTYDIDMTEYHILRMVRDTDDIRIYVDDEEVISEPHVGAGESWIGFIFGAGCTACTSEQYWDYLVFTTEGGFSPEELPSYASMLGEPGPAYGPKPADGSLHPNTWASLTWRAGPFAVSHDVYVGENFDDVNDGTGEAFIGNQANTSLVIGFPGFPVPDGLVPGTTYYWRVDEVNDADPNSPWKGNVWSFSIPPKTAYNPNPADGAEFVDPNATFSWTGGYGAKLHTVYIGAGFDEVNDAVGGAPQGITTYSPGPLELEKVYYWRIDESDGLETHKGDIWSFTTPGAVGNPQPANGAVDVQIIAKLSWTPADNAASHELYFGTDRDAVNSATTASPEYIGPRALGSESYDPGKLAWNSAYYWRVDEVYATETIKGLVWSFETADFILVDDFESYNDIDPPDEGSNRIFDVWIDGFGTTTNGAIVGNDLPPYAETRRAGIHGGAQSMPYFYDNNNKTSEATLTLVYPRDWTEEGVTKLSLWFRGASANAADRMFVALNGNTVVYHDDASATQKTGWNEWVIDLAAFAGVDLTNVNSITIGIGTKGSPAATGGTGTMYFDDIRLIR
ncbi:MAG: hypothetical protein CEE38_02090 [Planctomycetes bacterium B3_Pla]|nr:MAG: hypothetical protein CEE38_02090 [Planctomycetes bacterium B3_Pla]